MGMRLKGDMAHGNETRDKGHGNETEMRHRNETEGDRKHEVMLQEAVFLTLLLLL